MTNDLAAAADKALEDVLAETGARDPREYYRERLKALKLDDPAAYKSAVDYYQDVLIPAVASGSEQPLDAWTEYGRVLAQAAAPGRTVTVDPSGKAHPYEGPAPAHLILHLPDAKGGRALLVGLPAELTSAQRATYDVLVSGKQRSKD